MIQNALQLRGKFPQLAVPYLGKQLVYLDSAATTLKPQSVIDKISRFYTQECAPVHRGIYTLAEDVTARFEGARSTIASFIAATPGEIIWTSGTTDSINTVASAWALHQVKRGDSIVISELEHHSNLVPWQKVCESVGAMLRYIPITHHGTLDYAAAESIITKNTKLVAITHRSNAIGTKIDISRISELTRSVGAALLVDAAQTIAHELINVATLNCDFLAFSGHKMYGPTGIGILYINKKRHHEIQPVHFGGGMVTEVDFFTSSYLPLPRMLEAGTPPIVQVLGLESAVQFIQEGFTQIIEIEHAISRYAHEELKKIKRVNIIGDGDQTSPIISFTIDGIHAHDVAAYLDTFGIAVRAGTHCAQPLAKKLGYAASVRVSLGCYTSIEDIDRLLNALKTLH